MRAGWSGPLAILLLVIALVVLGYSLVTGNLWGMGASWILCVAAGTMLTVPLLMSRHTRDFER